MAQAPGPITGRSFDVCTNTRSITRVVCINVRTRGETTWLIAKKGGSSIGTSDLILLFHYYSDLIMGAMVSQITSVSIATVCSCAGAKKLSKLRATDLCKGNSPVTGKFPVQRASNTENVSIGWHHHAKRPYSLWAGCLIHEPESLVNEPDTNWACVTTPTSVDSDIFTLDHVYAFLFTTRIYTPSFGPFTLFFLVGSGSGVWSVFSIL